MIKKTGNIVIALLLFISTTGVNISIHFCNGKIYDIGLFSKAENCCIPETPASHHHMHKQMAHMDKDCDEQAKTDNCDDEVIKVHTNSDYLISQATFNFNEVVSDIAPISPIVIWDAITLANINRIEKILPQDDLPPGKFDTLALFQAYLI